MLRLTIGLLLALALSALARAETPVWTLKYRWLDHYPARTLSSTFPAPAGFERPPAHTYSFTGWLRDLPLKPADAAIVLFDGRRRSKQDGAAAIVDIDVGNRDLQQCADAVIRLRGEYLYASGKAVAFNFTSGDRSDFAGWMDGKTAQINGNRVTWVKQAPRESAHASFRQWLDTVFTYAGSLSLQRELKPVADVAMVQPGDVLIQGGSPGHAVIVLDVARDANNQPAVLLAQSFMPAQSIHVLRNPQGGVWFFPKAGQPIVTPDWRFVPADLRRFAD